MLGSGILTTSGAILGLVKSPDAVLTVWLVAGCHAVLGAFCYGIIARRIRENGGEASILRQFFTPALGEIAGWVSFIVGFAASNAASAIGFGAYLAKACPALGALVKTAAVCAILLVTLLHSFSGPLGIRIQTGMAVLKFGMLAGLTSWGLSHTPVVVPSEPGAVAAAPFGSAWGLAVMFSMFAYLGWSAAIYSSAETRDAKRNVPRAMLLGTLVVMLLYLGVNVVLLRHIPLSELSTEKAVLELLVRKMFGSEAAVAFSGLVAFALLSSLGASAFLGPRVLDAMLAWYRSKPPDTQRVQEQHQDTRQPSERTISPRLLWLQAGLSMAMIVSGTFEQILTVTGFLLGFFP
ncbi:MAG: amino acid permease, partial [Verrucomicrobia bacterium]|nr:amino acid permease [Verrucomicrobiota bacterium]